MPLRARGTCRPEPALTAPLHEECWAKTTPSGQPGIPVVQHCRAAGIVAAFLAERVPNSLCRLRPDVGVILAALHDVGKVCPGFQKKCTAWLTAHPLPPALLGGAEEDHAKVSQKALQDILGRDSPLRWWAATVGAHHGRLKGDVVSSLSDGGDAWAAERLRLIEQLIREFGPLPTQPPPGPKPWDCGALWFSAGMIAVADWLASDERTFPPSKVLSPADMRDRAQHQINRIGFGALSCQPGRCFRDLFPFEPLLLQAAVAGSATAPGVYVVEGPMGCGKTEAALAAAYNLLSTGQATGLYFALPTQVTSNRIHLRVAEFLNRLNTDAVPRLIHGNSWLLDAESPTLLNPSVADPKDPDLKQSVWQARDWFASPRRALLAPAGVGTVDQALLGVVAAKHFFVRQYALAGKVVILDEVHSYDLYTGTLIDVLIPRLRELGATVIVLSATLTASRRRQLLGLADTATAANPAYPLVSAVQDNAPDLIQRPVPAGTSKAVRVRFVELESLLDASVERAERGECVLWIRNTIDEAQQTYQRLKGTVRQGGPRIGLLHSRFPQFQREQLENEWIEALGKDEGKRPTNGCILVSTQVAEQSVDIDADLLITDPAPTDMLLQRVGRLWRHERQRPDGAQCRVWIAALDLDARALRDADVPELKAAFGKSAKVYAPYVLVRTLDLWRERRSLELPDDIRPLIEATYAGLPDEPAAWCELRKILEAQKERMSHQALANSNPWQVQLADEEGLQTRWNGLPTAMLLPLAKLFSWDNRHGASCELLDGTRCEPSTDKWDFATARAIHRNLVKVPLWTVRARTKQAPSWLSQYVPGPVVACKLVDETLFFLYGDKTCLTYRDDLGVVINRTAPAYDIAWSQHEEPDDEFDE